MCSLELSVLSSGWTLVTIGGIYWWKVSGPSFFSDISYIIHYCYISLSMRSMVSRVVNVRRINLLLNNKCVCSSIKNTVLGQYKNVRLSGSFT